MTEQIFLRNIELMPEGMKHEALSFFDYLMFKYQSLLPQALARKPKKPFVPSFLKGNVKMADDFDAPLEDFAEYMEDAKHENDGPPRKTPKAGFLKGTFVMTDAFDAPLEDFKDYM